MNEEKLTSTSGCPFHGIEKIASLSQSSKEISADPFAYLDLQLQSGADYIELPGTEWYLSDPNQMKQVLANKEGLFHQHSDFFFGGAGLIGNSTLQQKLGRVLLKRLQEYCLDTAELTTLAQGLRNKQTCWPDEGNLLFYSYFKGLLLDGGDSETLRRLLDKTIPRVVFSGAKSRRPTWRRKLFQIRFYWRMAQAIDQRRDGQFKDANDLLSLLVREAGSDLDNTQLTEVYLSCLFALTGSLGFTLGWSLYQLGQTLPNCWEQIDSSDIVRESLRLWPIAWNLTRSSKTPIEIAGQSLSSLVVCPYTAHRNPKFWPDADQFMPQRWADANKDTPFLAFGWGAHKCVAASLSVRLVALLLDHIRPASPTIQLQTLRPLPEAALAPPRFILSFVPGESDAKQ
ncbi:cytochrome P450 [Shewanella submarina]|uniref:Cytochrome P450 n=1 Tax=Shewanella submarina TaxID=2016376 RepID=A0ABV7GJ34_9GAMM|nr:cytochrome P450 [Shewanella submarina]